MTNIFGRGGSNDQIYRGFTTDKANRAVLTPADGGQTYMLPVKEETGRNQPFALSLKKPKQVHHTTPYLQQGGADVLYTSIHHLGKSIARVEYRSKFIRRDSTVALRFSGNLAPSWQKGLGSRPTVTGERIILQLRGLRLFLVRAGSTIPYLLLPSRIASELALYLRVLGRD